jgi:alpha-L-fucosidase
MTDDRDDLIEQVAAAWRPRDLDGGVRSHPAWHDLAQDDRAHAARLAAAQRRLEAALDPRGLSTTAHAVLARITGSRS